MKYFWHYSADTTPSPVVDPGDWLPSDRLCVASTQTGLPSSRQRALVKEWCDLLPTLTGVRLLWLSSKVPQALFDAVCRMPNLEGLWIKWSSVKSIAGIEALPNLKYFHLGSSAQLTSIDPLSTRTGLKWLGLENLSKIQRLDSLKPLSQLEGLSIEGGMYSPWIVESLSPLSGLAGLRYLSMANLRSEDHTLRPLFALRNLETLVVPKWWDAAELAELHTRNPRLSE